MNCIVSGLQAITFYKVLVIALDVFESSIIDERHFQYKSEADEFARMNTYNGRLAVVITM